MGEIVLASIGAACGLVSLVLTVAVAVLVFVHEHPAKR